MQAYFLIGLIWLVAVFGVEARWPTVLQVVIFIFLWPLLIAVAIYSAITGWSPPNGTQVKTAETKEPGSESRNSDPPASHT